VTKRTRSDRLEEILVMLRGGFDELEILADEVQEHVDNMGETNLQYTEKYERLEEAASSLDDGRTQLEEAIDTLEEVEF